MPPRTWLPACPCWLPLHLRATAGAVLEPRQHRPEATEQRGGREQTLEPDSLDSKSRVVCGHGLGLPRHPNSSLNTYSLIGMPPVCVLRQVT